MKTLKDLREANGLSLRDLACLMEGTRGGGKGYQAALHRMERRELSPTIERLRDTLQAMGYRLELQAVRGKERIPLEVRPRAKDTGAKDAPKISPEPPIKADSRPQQEPLPVIHEPETEPLETLLNSILKKSEP